MFKPLALASTITLVALAAQAQDGVVPLAPGVAATMAASASSSSSDATATSAASTPAFTGTIATLDLPGASSSLSSSGPAKPVVIPPDKKTLRKLTDATVNYVRNQRGWMDGSYKVYFYGYDNDLTIMAIDLTQGDNAHNFVSAEGQPFKVAIDPATLQIKRELY